MAKSNNLNAAKAAKNDEFYTQLADIEKEMPHYQRHFKDKIIFCNCDDPTQSNFWRYFHLNFELLGLKKLVATYYDANASAYKFEYEGGDDCNIETSVKTSLIQNGDFRSDECIALLKNADIIVTNPPFSLFREYVAQLMEYKKKFIIIGNMNAITHKDFFPLLQTNRVWLGYNSPKEFSTPDGLTKKFGNILWFTNLDHAKRHDPLVLSRKYADEPELFRKYDNYDAINVDKITDIPCDYNGIMGVPISFLNKYCPEQFEILGLSRKAGLGLYSTKDYSMYRETRQDGSQTGSSGKKTNGNPVMTGRPKKCNFFVSPDGDIVYSLYGRIFIRKR